MNVSKRVPLALLAGLLTFAVACDDYAIQESDMISGHSICVEHQSDILDVYKVNEGFFIETYVRCSNGKHYNERTGEEKVWVKDD